MGTIMNNGIMGRNNGIMGTGIMGTRNNGDRYNLTAKSVF